MVRTDSGTSYRLSKSKTLLSSRKVSIEPNEYTKEARTCQSLKKAVRAISTVILKGTYEVFWIRCPRALEDSSFSCLDLRIFRGT
jgi:hypothetical protein